MTSTRIYCRPICPTKPPKEANCRTCSAAQAEHAAGLTVPAVPPGIGAGPRARRRATADRASARPTHRSRVGG
ncbi:MAG: Ada metal-binding domain-containing protein [Verrucomicrobiota bacterium]